MDIHTIVSKKDNNENQQWRKSAKWINKHLINMPCQLRLLNSLLAKVAAFHCQLYYWFWFGFWLIFPNYYTHLQLELFMVSVLGYRWNVWKLHHLRKPQSHAAVCHLYTTICSAISLLYHGAALLISTSSVVHITVTPWLWGIYLLHIYTQSPGSIQISNPCSQGNMCNKHPTAPFNSHAKAVQLY